MRLHKDQGETLVETILTVVIIGVAVTALVAALATTASAGAAHRNNVVADTVMRNYAEATKAAARTCVTGQTYAVVFQPPTGYTVSVAPTGTACPTVLTTRLLTLSVTGPTKVAQTMAIRIRTP